MLTPSCAEKLADRQKRKHDLEDAAAAAAEESNVVESDPSSYDGTEAEKKNKSTVTVQAKTPPTPWESMMGMSMTSTQVSPVDAARGSDAGSYRTGTRGDVSGSAR